MLKPTAGAPTSPVINQMAAPKVTDTLQLQVRCEK